MVNDSRSFAPVETVHSWEDKNREWGTELQTSISHLVRKSKFPGVILGIGSLSGISGGGCVYVGDRHCGVALIVRHTPCAIRSRNRLQIGETRVELSMVPDKFITSRSLTSP